MEVEEGRDVIDILVMFEALKDAYEGLDDKEGIDEYRIKFRGFSGNDETQHMGFLEYLVEQDNKFTHVVDRGNYNSHSPMLPYYRKMLRRWEDMGKPRYPVGLNKAQIMELIEY